MRGKHSIVTPTSTVRRRYKIAATVLAPGMVLAMSLGVASALTADEELAKEIECGVPGSGRTDCAAPEPAGDTQATAEDTSAATEEAAGAGAAGGDDSSTGGQGASEEDTRAGSAGTGSSQTVVTETGSDAGSAVVADPSGFASNLSCELLDRFGLAGEECAAE